MQGLFTFEKLERIKRSVIAVFGLGGVGGYALESLARSGIGTFYLIDGDIIEPSNVNRQLLALASTIGMSKVEVARRRVKEINEDAEVFTCLKMIKPDMGGNLLADDFVGSDFPKADSPLSFLDEVDAIVDATDYISLKVALAKEAEKRNILIISAGGAGNRLDSSAF